MAKPNYQFEKRQREQKKARKKAEKAQRKAAELPPEQSLDAPATPVEPVAD